MAFRESGSLSYWGGGEEIKINMLGVPRDTPLMKV